jgi:hypothetical protein
VVGDLVYYIRNDMYFSQIGGDIYGVRTSGRNTKILDGANNAAVVYLVVYGDRVYYTDVEGRLCSVSAEGGAERVLTNEEVYGFNVADDRIYYTTWRGATMFQSVDTGGGDYQEIPVVQGAHTATLWLGGGVYVAHDRLYFISGDGDGGLAMYSMGLDGTGLTQITN